ncbi:MULTISPECIES: hypothetical protein [Citrobacter]|uniref:hypothetical protein n=1 Tax=Citrobacter TaxID=544 RepID=UPI001C7DCF2E|nr:MULTISPECIES: hypothetical protein [Citrobacter]MDM3077497.1 hypothetical protein [Citrobacter sp. Cf138]MDM3201735.1 hypothetical protein [Citrobacter sp. Cf097]WOR51243.1 hypothetical protein R4T09_06575 [Citrobacter freundii]HBU9965156.1 hypothetical protein [Citrobacter freundii]
MKQDYFSYEELLMGMFNISDDLYETTDFDELAMEHFEVSFEQFANIVDALLPFTALVRSPLSGKNYHAFLKDGIAFIKTEASA